MTAMLDLFHDPEASPRALNGLFGVEQWFDLMQRGLRSILDESYAFVRREPPLVRQEVPTAVQNELSMCLLLTPLLSAGMDRQFAPVILACDASPQFGFGVCACRCSPSEAAEVGRLGEKRGDCIRLHREPGAPEGKERLGTPHKLHYGQEDFQTVISAKAKWAAHPGVLEAHGLLLAVR